jgi:hypothetical protein
MIHSGSRAPTTAQWYHLSLIRSHERHRISANHSICDPIGILSITFKYTPLGVGHLDGNILNLLFVVVVCAYDCLAWDIGDYA